MRPTQVAGHGSTYRSAYTCTACLPRLPSSGPLAPDQPLLAVRDQLWFLTHGRAAGAVWGSRKNRSTHNQLLRREHVIRNREGWKQLGSQSRIPGCLVLVKELKVLIPVGKSTSCSCLAHMLYRCLAPLEDATGSLPIAYRAELVPPVCFSPLASSPSMHLMVLWPTPQASLYLEPFLPSSHR